MQYSLAPHLAKKGRRTIPARDNGRWVRERGPVSLYPAHGDVAGRATSRP